MTIEQKVIKTRVGLLEPALTEAVKWREAILHRDLETVVAYAFPEHRDWIMKTEDRWWANIESLIER